MSNWTHVAAVFRVDDIASRSQNFDFDQIFGREVVWTDDNVEEYASNMLKARESPGDYLPLGSEGTLQKTVWRNPDSTSMAQFVVTVWGDLRDHDSVEEIEAWFHGCCRKLKDWLRQATCTISNELNGSKTLSCRFYDEEEEDEDGE